MRVEKVDESSHKSCQIQCVAIFHTDFMSEMVQLDDKHITKGSYPVTNIKFNSLEYGGVIFSILTEDYGLVEDIYLIEGEDYDPTYHNVIELRFSGEV